MPVIFGQGMRRSGTTILFDLFWGDGRFRCWYEPLNRAKSKKGGGSRARQVDYSAPVRELRERLAAALPGVDAEDYNWGAPFHPEREFETSFPVHVRDYVRAMVEGESDVFLKFTRASHKVAELAAIRPDAYLLHLVRDPRSVATSHIFRVGRETRERIVSSGTFFTQPDDFNQWRTEAMANHLVATREEYAHLRDEPAYVKCMLVWKELYTRTRDDGLRHFPGRYLVVWHDALCAEPLGTLKELYASFGWKTRLRVRRWARRNVRPPKPWHDPQNPAWERAIELLDLQPLIDELRR